MNKLAKSLHSKTPFSIIHCRSYIAALVGLQFKKKLGVNFIFDMRGFYADERVDGKIWNLKNPLYNWVYQFFKEKEIDFFSNADYTISLTENGKREIESWKEFKTSKPSIQVIPCCADLSFFDYHQIEETKKSSLKKELQIAESDFVVSYLGSVGTWYMLDEMLAFFKCLLQKKPHSKFLFITNEDASLIYQAANKIGIENKCFIIKSAQRKEVPLYLSLSSVSLFFIKPVFSKKASSPTKQGEIMGMGVPLICNANVGDTDSIVLDTGCGVVIKEFTNSAYAAVVEQIELIENLNAEKIRAGAQKYYSLEMGAQKYLSVYKKILVQNA